MTYRSRWLQVRMKRGYRRLDKILESSYGGLECICAAQIKFRIVF